MSDVRLLHAVAAAIYGFAFAAALLGLPRFGIVCCAVAGLLLIWCGEKLRHHLVLRGDRP